MSNRDYPRIGSRRDMRAKWGHKIIKRRHQPDEIIPNEKTPCRCIACGAPAMWRVDVEVNWFRGDDEVVKACTPHSKDAAALIAGLGRQQVAT